MGKLNWMLGLKRLYQALWALYWVILTLAIIADFDTFDSGFDFVGLLLMYAAPAVLYVVGKWIIMGFLSQQSGEAAPQKR